MDNFRVSKGRLTFNSIIGGAPNGFCFPVIPSNQWQHILNSGTWSETEISVTTYGTEIDFSSTSATFGGTLANGKYKGQLKIIRTSNSFDSEEPPFAQITYNNSDVFFLEPHAGVSDYTVSTLLWDGSKWVIIDAANITFPV